MAVFYTDSGSFFNVSVTSSLLVSGSTSLKGITPAYQDNIVTIDAATGLLYYTASSAFGGGGGLTGGAANYIPRWLGASSQTTSSLYQVAPNQIIIGATASVHTGYEEALAVYQGATTSYNLISGHSDVDSYSQLNIKNFNTGSSASSDLVATADNGDESTYYIDMGINSSTYSATSLVGSYNDAYVYSTGNNLYIGNASAGRSLVLFNGGTDAIANAKMYVHDTGVIGINTDTTGDPSYPPALRVLPPNSNTFNIIETEADLNGFVQSVFTNINSGPSASSDIVAHNDLGTTYSHYIDMGINSSTYDQQYVGGPNDAYIIAAGQHLHIGNIGYSSSIDSSIYFYTQGTTDEYTKLYISASGEIGVNTLDPQHKLDVSGSGRFTHGLTVTGSFTSLGVSSGIDTNTGQLQWDNGAGMVSKVDWQGAVLNNSTGNLSIDWEGRVLYTPAGNNALIYTDDVVAESNLYNREALRIDVNGEELSNTLYNYSGQSIRSVIDAGSSAGDVVYLHSDGIWYAVDQTTSSSSKLLGINLGSNWVLLEGDVVLEEATNVKTPVLGEPLYIYQSTSDLGTTAPTSGYVRTLGYCYYQNTITTANWIVKFRPANDWFKI